MKWRNLFISGALVGAFSLGSMFAPINELAANTKNEPAVETAPLTTNEVKTAYTCPITGAEMGSGAGMVGKYFSGTIAKVISEELGMSVDEVHAARLKGKSIAVIAEEKGIAVDPLMDKMLEARKAELEQLVKDGKVTKEQMNLMLENMEARIKTAIERENTGPMNGRGGGMGMGQGARSSSRHEQSVLNSYDDARMNQN